MTVVTVLSAIVLIIVVGLLIVFVARLSVGFTGACWKEVIEPFGLGFSPDSIVELHLNPGCLDRVVITDEAYECKQVCGKFEDCSKRCVKGDTEKSFFIFVRKDEGWWGQVKKASSC